MVSGGLEVKIKTISWQIFDFVYKLDIQPESPGHLVLQGVVGGKVLIVVSSHFKIGQLEEKRQKIMKKVEKKHKNRQKNDKKVKKSSKITKNGQKIIKKS